MHVAVRQLKHYSWAALLTATAVGCLVWAQPHANLTTTALVLVLVVTVSAIAWGSGPALITALLSVFCFNYFFIPPIHTFTIAEPQNWIAFVVFVATAVAVGQLSSRARNRAEEAEARRIEIERLYRQLTEAFDRASEAETLRRSEMPAQDIINIAVDRAATPLRERIINVSVANKLPPLVVDGASISGVIYELLVNAAKYSAPDSMIHINAQQISANEVEIAVENEGAALPVAVRQRVFEKFYRGPKEQGEKQGFGLGLSIARGVVEAHGGRIRMDAGPRGAGTAVRFTVPCAPGANADALTS